MTARMKLETVELGKICQQGRLQWYGHVERGEDGNFCRLKTWQF